MSDGTDRSAPAPDVDDVKLDLDRRRRTGLTEAVLAEPKSVEQLCRVLDQAERAGAPLLLTRLQDQQFAALPRRRRDLLDHDPVSGTAFFGPVAPLATTTRVAVVCAGTSDRPVAAEAERTLLQAGQPSLSISDVGVAGLWRVLERVDELTGMDVVIVVAGMDGALPTVVAGLVPGVVVAVPTSVGYGVATGGQTALHASLASCSPGLVVVNIDNGYGAAIAALRVLNRLDR